MWASFLLRELDIEIFIDTTTTVPMVCRIRHLWRVRQHTLRLSLSSIEQPLGNTSPRLAAVSPEGWRWDFSGFPNRFPLPLASGFHPMLHLPSYCLLTAGSTLVTTAPVFAYAF